MQTHPRHDLDTIATIFLMMEYGNMDEEVKISFLSGGDEEVGLSNLFFRNESIVFVDRGRRDLDHHGEDDPNSTSCSKVAEKLGIADHKTIRRLIGLVRRADLQGQSLPFDLNDIIKCLQRRTDLEDKDRLRIGIRATRAAMQFQKQELKRKNSWVKKFIEEFLAGRNIPPRFQQYLELLKNPRFERPFDIVEILCGESLQSIETAKSFGRELLESLYQDTEKYLEAQAEVEKAEHITINRMLIIAATTENPKFNVAARAKGAAVIIQKSSHGIQIFFDTKKVDDRLTDTLISMLRLEECLVQKRKLPDQRIDLRQAGKVIGIAEWHYAKFPKIGKKPPGRIILNGSLTAPNIPPSQISWEAILYIVTSAVRYYPRFNRGRWKQKRTKFHNKRVKGKVN